MAIVFREAYKSKYHNQKVEIDDYTFDSQKEAGRYLELRTKERARLISKLEIHPAYPIIINGLKICIYKPDFRYIDVDGRLIVEDVKSRPSVRIINGKRRTWSTRTAVYSIKKKLMKAVYNIDVAEM